MLLVARSSKLNQALWVLGWIRSFLLKIAKEGSKLAFQKLFHQKWQKGSHSNFTSACCNQTTKDRKMKNNTRIKQTSCSNNTVLHRNDLGRITSLSAPENVQTWLHVSPGRSSAVVFNSSRSKQQGWITRKLECQAHQMQIMCKSPRAFREMLCRHGLKVRWPFVRMFCRISSF